MRCQGKDSDRQVRRLVTVGCLKGMGIIGLPRVLAGAGVGESGKNGQGKGQCEGWNLGRDRRR